jgi:signal transduction histidine kinase/AraC-like DNA-binding protein
MIQDGTDVIIISPIEPDTIVNVIKRAYDKGIPIILIDRKINSQHFTAYVGGDNLEVGRDVGNYIASSRKNNVKVIELRGADVSSPVLERNQGFRQVINRFPGISILASVKGVETGIPKEYFAAILDSLSGKTVDYVYAFNDDMALQAWEVARQKGLEEQIKFIGVDGLNGPNNGIELVREGILEATILYPTGGAEAIELAMDVIDGKKVPKVNTLSTTVIDDRNADIMKNQFDKINDQQTDLENQIAAIQYQEERYYAQNNLLKVTMALLAIILSLSFYSVYSIFAIRKKNRQLELTNKRITVQRNQIEKIAEEVKVSNDAKLNFFTGLSHEFKTPITLILSSLESLSDITKEKSSKIMNEVELIYNNANRLLRLINQLLDFRKVEDRKFTLRASKTNVFTFSKNILKDFEREAKKRNISFKLNSNNEHLNLYIDRNLMDKVYFNLLSNAFKFTPENGKIMIDIRDHTNKETVSIHFKDSGIGIPEKEMDSVFQAFYRGSNNRKNSSGIGLHLSKQFVEMHKGSIEVRSVHGTEFVVTLYKDRAHFDESEIISDQDLVDTNVIDFSSEHLVDENYLVQEPEQGKEKYSILIIEDNRDLLLFLKSKFMLEYDIHLSDGTDALEKAFEIIPDIVLCDINLPDKNGFEICKILKGDLRTSHIPTVILTAMGDKESYLQGLESGADLYLTKPFSYSILVQSIKSLLYNREKLRFYYSSNIHKIEDSDSFGNLEQRFVNKLNVLIKDNLGNPDFSVEKLAEHLNISRVQLYRKVKALMGISISDYINNIRLEKAKSMLESTSLTIAEIAYTIGFSSPNYFSTAFKNMYGTPPGSFRKSV